MITTSLMLYFVPRRLHHGNAVSWADRLRPAHVRWISPFALAFGGTVIFSVV
jgi:hypothetical protein